MTRKFLKISFRKLFFTGDCFKFYQMNYPNFSMFKNVKIGHKIDDAIIYHHLIFKKYISHIISIDNYRRIIILIDYITISKL